MTVQVQVGDVLRVDCIFDYQGPAIPGPSNIGIRIRAAIGTKPLGIFNELPNGWADTNLQIASDILQWATFTQRLIIPLASGVVTHGATYAAYVKIYWGTSIYVFWEQDAAVYVVETIPPAAFQNLSVTIARG